MAQAQHRRGPSKKPPARSKGAAASGGANRLWLGHRRDLATVAIVVVGLFVALAEVGALGPVGRVISRSLSDLVGVGRYAVAVFLLGLGGALVWGRIEFDRARVGWGVALGTIAISAVADMARARPGLGASASVLARAGGWVGVLSGGGAASALGVAGALVLFVAIFVVAAMISTSVGLSALVRTSARFIGAVGRFAHRWWNSRPRPSDDEPSRVTPIALPDVAVAPQWAQFEPAESELTDDELDVYDEFSADSDEWGAVDVDGVDERVAGPDGEGRPRARGANSVRDPSESALAPSTWELPALTLLARTKDQRLDRAATDAAGAELVEALAAHGVETTLLGYTVGPTVTRFELELGPGVKVSRVTSLNKDIAYAMASADVRILAPIPGRSAIGVEVPNRQRSLVALGDLLCSDEAHLATHPLDVPIGRDIAGRCVLVNLGDMPHVLISGATGAGKSSAINSLITALVVRDTPDQLRLLLIDPKRVEMGQYNDLPHLLSPVVVDPKKAAGALAWAVREMERRYDVLAESGARDITSYQQMVARGDLTSEPSSAELVSGALERATGRPHPVESTARFEELPYIVIVVDELNDLMMVAARDVEESVVRIAQMARAVGIHLVLATQRPSVDVITGVIKANVPSRMAFAVSSLADSRVILDQAGAERLIGKGDMLLVTASSNVARRLQSPWVGEDEVRRVVDAWRAQGGRRETVVALDESVERAVSGGAGSGDDDDEVLRQARELVLRFQSGSTSMLQRKLRVGFARAGRLMDQLEQEGVVAAGDGSKARRVLYTLEEYDQKSVS